MTPAGVGKDDGSGARTGKGSAADPDEEFQGVDVRAGAAAAFELYDLRVEVVGPVDRTIYCGAKQSATS